jgi:hypothetical protein
MGYGRTDISGERSTKLGESPKEIHLRKQHGGELYKH